MDLTKQDLLKELNTSSWSSVRTYMSRTEFAHIKFKKGNGENRRRWFYLNITKEDIKHIKALMTRKKGTYCIQ